MSAAKPPDTRHLERRHLTWFATVYVPRPLQATLGKKLSKSLATHDLGEAQRLRHRAVAEFHDRIVGAGKVIPKAPPGDRMAEAMEDRASLMVDGDGGIADRAYAIEDEHGEEAAQAYFRVASGRSTPISFHVTGWIGESRYPPRSVVQHRGTVAELERWCAKAGVAADVEAITRKEAGRFIADAVAAKAARATVNRKLSTMRAYWGWLVHRGHASADPWTGQRLAKGRLAQTDDEGVRPFTTAELSRLLTGGADAVLADFIRVAALTGARVESIAQLKVRECQGGVISILRDKTKSGTRRFPIHSDLTEVIARRCEGKGMGEWVFPECVTTLTGSRSASVVKRFRTYRMGLGIHDPVKGRRGSLVNFHSLRKSFVTAAIQAGQPEYIVQQVIGHKQQGITMGVYHGGDTLERLRECVEAVRLPLIPPPITTS